MYGPYVDLPPGSYLVTFGVSCSDAAAWGNTPCGYLDICTGTGGNVLIEKAFSPDDLVTGGGKIDLGLSPVWKTPS